jgi:hypothetical protein
MLHARIDYNRIQDPALQDPSLLSDGSSPIGEDEPVFLVRAKDAAFNATVMAWMEAHLDAGGDPAMHAAMAAHLGRAIAWRKKHGTKVADAPHDVLKSS